MWKTALTLALAALLMAVPAVRADEAQLIATLKSADASVKDKADACRLLSRCGTAAAVLAHDAHLAVAVDHDHVWQGLDAIGARDLLRGIEQHRKRHC